MPKAIRKFHPEYQIMAYNRTKDILEDAVFDGIVDIACTERDTRFALCDYIFLCATVDYNLECLPWLKQTIRPGCILTDVGSVKGEIHKKITALDMAANFIGGHPMAGSEKTGYEHSTDHLIENAYYILTPSEEVGLDKIGNYTELVSSIGALPMITGRSMTILLHVSAIRPLYCAASRQRSSKAGFPSGTYENHCCWRL